MKNLASKLKKGDTIGIVSPSNFVDEDDREAIETSKKIFEDYGFKIKFSKHCFDNTTGYGATAKEKADDINEMYKDKNIKAIISVKGGFNSNSIYEYLDLNMIKENSKILFGYSDATSYINYICVKTGNIGFIGPNFKTFALSPYCFENFVDHMVNGSRTLLTENDECETIYPIPNSNNSQKSFSKNLNYRNRKNNCSSNIVEGELIGGNLSLINELSDELDFNEKILFLEDLAFESPSALVSNYIYNLKQKGIFNKIAGLWLGNYAGDVSIEQIVLDTLDEINFPIIKSNNFGHIEKLMNIPIGVKAKISKNHIELIEDYLN